MLKINIYVDDVENLLEAKLDTATASLADLTICERMLRRYLDQVIRASNELLDRDTKGQQKRKEKEIKFPEREQLQTEAEEEFR